ncbi:hypothetical protein [Paenibacillus sp. TH7-28]
MSTIDELSKRAKPSLFHYVDVYIRERLGFTKSSYNERDIEEIFNDIVWRYNNIDLNKNSEHIKEIRDRINTSEQFKKEIKKYIISWIEDRPTKERHDYYKSLCLQYGLQVKEMIRSEHLEGRIAKILKSGGKSQNYR